MGGHICRCVFFGNGGGERMSFSVGSLLNSLGMDPKELAELLNMGSVEKGLVEALSDEGEGVKAGLLISLILSCPSCWVTEEPLLRARGDI